MQIITKIIWFLLLWGFIMQNTLKVLREAKPEISCL